MSKNTRNKVNKAIRKGLTLEPADKFGINIFYKLIEERVPKNQYYYNDKFNIFNQDDSIDLFLVSIDYTKYLLNSQKLYEKEVNVSSNNDVT